MALHQFLGMEIGVPNPEDLDAFFAEIGLVGGGGRWGTADMPGQIEITEAPYRQLRAMRVGCDSESDLAALVERLEGFGVASEHQDGRVSCMDPTGTWKVIVEPSPSIALSTQPHRSSNRPGERTRQGVRAEVITEDTARPPRRLGHVVLGSPDPMDSAKFFMDGIGFRLSDQVPGLATFMRCSSDHHNLLIHPGVVPYINHYAFEHDDTDAVGAAASRYLSGREGEHVVGPGRHVIGANVFWYMNDPCGTMFEFFSDMDDIPDDDAWEAGTHWSGEEFAVWGQNDPPEIFFSPRDIDGIAQAWTAERE